MPGVQADDIRRRDVGDATAQVETELQLALHQVQADEVAPAVVQLAVVQEQAVGRSGEEPELDGEGAADALQAGQLQETVARHLGDQEFCQLGVHCGIRVI